MASLTNSPTGTSSICAQIKQRISIPWLWQFHKFHGTPKGGWKMKQAPPHSVDAEMGVLGSMLISPRQAIPTCVERIKQDHFHVPAHQTIYSVLVDLWNTAQEIDLIIFTQVLRDRNLLDAIGGAFFVTEVSNFVPTAANLEYYIDIVREKRALRKVEAATAALHQNRRHGGVGSQRERRRT